MAVMREVSSSLGQSQLSFLPRRRIDIRKAMAQHRAYQQCLAELGVRVISLPAEPGLPDAVFIEDVAVVVDELAVMTRMGVATRQPEVHSVITVLWRHRRLRFLTEPATLEGGDVMRIGRRLCIGISKRTHGDGIAQLRAFLEPYGYQVKAVEVTGCLHLKTGCSYIGRNTILVNRSWVDTAPLKEFDIIDVHRSEVWAANALVVRGVVLLPHSFPQTRALLQDRGFSVCTIDISELQKAEGGLSCLSIIFEAGADGRYTHS